MEVTKFMSINIILDRERAVIDLEPYNKNREDSSTNRNYRTHIKKVPQESCGTFSIFIRKNQLT